MLKIAVLELTSAIEGGRIYGDLRFIQRRMAVNRDCSLQRTRRHQSATQLFPPLTGFPGPIGVVEIVKMVPGRN